MHRYFQLLITRGLLGDMGLIWSESARSVPQWNSARRSGSAADPCCDY
jgi:hypothetical protein